MKKLHSYFYLEIHGCENMKSSLEASKFIFGDKVFEFIILSVLSASSKFLTSTLIDSNDERMVIIDV